MVKNTPELPGGEGYVSVVLPSYNERENIIEAIRRISKAVGSHLKEIIIVDDSSPDGTGLLVKEYAHPKVRLIERINQRGLASALYDGIMAAKGEAVVWMDCDLGLSPEEIPGLISHLDTYDIAIASRYVKGGKDPRPFFRIFLSWMINGFSMVCLGGGVRDYTSGFAAVRKHVFNSVSFSKKGFGEYFIEFAYKAKKNGFQIIEVPCVYTIRSGGISKSDGDLKTLLKLGKDYSVRVLKLRFGLKI